MVILNRKGSGYEVAIGNLIKDVVTVMEVSQLTGEVREYEKNIYDQEKLNEQRDYLRKVTEFENVINEMGQYYHYFYNLMQEVDIPPSMKCRFLFISSFMDYDTGKLVIVNNGRKRGMTKDDLMTKLNLSEREFFRTLKCLKDANLISTYKKEFYEMNTNYALRGKVSSKNIRYTRVFIESIQQLYSKCKATQHKKLYYFYMLLPYINVHFNCVCKPEHIELDNENFIDRLDINDVCEILGCPKAHFARFKKDLLAFKLDNKMVMAFVTGYNGTFIKINPYIYYSGTENSIDFIKGLMSDFGYR